MTRWVEVHGEKYHAAFALDERGQLLETVEWDGATPLWDEAGVADELRGEDPGLQQQLVYLLHHINGRKL